MDRISTGGGLKPPCHLNNLLRQNTYTHCCVEGDSRRIFSAEEIDSHLLAEDLRGQLHIFDNREKAPYTWPRVINPSCYFIAWPQLMFFAYGGLIFDHAPGAGSAKLRRFIHLTV
jgi:hypothetical protein